VNGIVTKFRQGWTWLLKKIGLAAVLIVLAFSGQAKADDATNLELWKQQMKINALLTQRLDAVERRVALLEQRTPTPYQPGTTPPQPSVYTAPAYTPPSPHTPIFTAGPGGWDADFLRQCYGR
jgi:hypothetical protein